MKTMEELKMVSFSGLVDWGHDRTCHWDKDLGRRRRWYVKFWASCVWNASEILKYKCKIRSLLYESEEQEIHLSTYR